MGDLSFLSLSLTTIHINWKCIKIKYSQSIGEQGYVDSEMWNFFKLSKSLASLKGRSLMSIMLAHLFLFLGNQAACKPVDVGYCSQNTPSLGPQQTRLLSSLLPYYISLSTSRLTPVPVTLPLLTSEGITIPKRDILNQFVLILESFLIFL